MEYAVEYRVEQHYKINGEWKDEYVVATFLDISKRSFLRQSPDYEKLKNQFISAVKIESTFVSSIALPKKKCPKLSSDSMIHVINNENDLLVYTDEEQEESNQTEVQQFLVASPITGLSALQWWNKKKKNYPQLSVLARQYLCIAISSALRELFLMQSR